MLSRYSEDKMWSRYVFELVMTSRSYFGEMNSTLGSVVPLAMFIICLKRAVPESDPFNITVGLYFRISHGDL